MKKIIILMFSIFILMPVVTFANQDDDFKEVAVDVKYYKTVTIYNNASNINYLTSYPVSTTYNITKEEYYSSDDNNVNVQPLSSTYVETTYKRLTTSISSNGSYYRYKAVLYWKKIPKVRSYDIIGIGRYGSVKVKGTPSFSLKSCTSEKCTTTASAVKMNFTNGSGASFKIPTGSLISLQATYYYDVEKNTDATILTQKAYGDYSHATTTVTSAESQKYQVSSIGISLDSAVYNKYDTIDTATATWTGSW